MHWNPQKPPFRVWSCKVCIEFWDIQEWELISHQVAVLQRWHYYAKKKRTWQDQAREWFNAYNKEQNLDTEGDDSENGEPEQDFPKGVDFGELKV